MVESGQICWLPHYILCFGEGPAVLSESYNFLLSLIQHHAVVPKAYHLLCPKLLMFSGSSPKESLFFSEMWTSRVGVSMTGVHHLNLYSITRRKTILKDNLTIFYMSSCGHDRFRWCWNWLVEVTTKFQRFVIEMWIQNDSYNKCTGHKKSPSQVAQHLGEGSWFLQICQVSKDLLVTNLPPYPFIHWHILWIEVWIKQFNHIEWE